MYEHTAASHELAETPVTLPDVEDAADGVEERVPTSDHANESA